MSAPTTRDEKRLRRMGRYLKDSPRVVQHFEWQDENEEVKVYTDSDLAGCDRTRKSTSGGAVLRGSHCLKFWSKTQQTIATSSGEAELTALVKGCYEGIGIQSFLDDAGVIPEQMGVYADAAAAIGVTKRAGIGRIRHLDVGMLWVQQKQWDKRFTVHKVEGAKNTSDMLIKNVPRELCTEHMGRLRFRRAEGRAAAAAELVGQR